MASGPGTTSNEKVLHARDAWSYGQECHTSTGGSRILHELLEIGGRSKRLFRKTPFPRQLCG